MDAPPDYTLAQLHYFVRVAERGTISGAADDLHVAQSAVSAAIVNLERQLRVQLFVRRHARGVVLTPAGERLLGDARDVLRRLIDLTDAARQLGGAVAGGLTIGCFVTLAPFHLPRLLSDVAEHHPLLEVSVVAAEIPALSRSLHEGICEAALLYDIDLDDELEREVLAEFAPYVIVAPDHPRAGAGAIRLTDIVGEPMVLLDLPASREYFRLLVETTGAHPHVRYRTSSYETVRALVARGHGFAILNQRPYSDLTYDGGRVVALTLEDDLPPLPAVLARLRHVRPTARCEAFAARCRAVFAEQAASSLN